MDLFIEGPHGSLELVSKLVKNLLMPLVILVIDLLLNTTIVDDNSSEALLII